MPEQYKALQGFKDILPDEQPYWRMVEQAAIEVANLYGYRRIETPVLEQTSLFRRTAGERSDVVAKEINRFGDRSCRPQYIEILRDYYRSLLRECCEDCKVRFQKNPLRMLDCKEPQDQAKIAAGPKMIDYLCEPGREHFAAVQRFLRLYD